MTVARASLRSRFDMTSIVACIRSLKRLSSDHPSGLRSIALAPSVSSMFELMHHAAHDQPALSSTTSKSATHSVARLTLYGRLVTHPPESPAPRRRGW
jgi:hypothetical protein